MNGNSPPAFRFVDRCPECGYALAGLADEGACPECGNRYDQRAMILLGDAMGWQASLVNASPLTFRFTVLLSVIPAAFAWLQVDTRSSFASMASALFWTLILVIGPLTRWGNQRPGRVRACLSSWGCLQLDQVEEGPLVRVLSGMLYLGVAIAVVVGGTFMIYELSGESVVFAFIGAIAVVCGLAAVTRHAWNKKIAHRQQTAPLHSVEAIAVNGSRWRDIGEITLTSTRAGRFRLRARLRSGYRQATSHALDLEFACELERARWIGARLGEWIRADAADATAEQGRRLPANFAPPDSDSARTVL